MNNNFDLQFNEKEEREFHDWYKNWRTEEMHVSPSDTSLEIWMEIRTNNQFENIENLLGKILWYSTGQERYDELCTDVWYDGVTIKNGKVTYEDAAFIIVEGYNKPIDKKELSRHVFLDRNSLLYNLNYDGASLHFGKQFNPKFLKGDFIYEELLY